MKQDELHGSKTEFRDFFLPILLIHYDLNRFLRDQQALQLIDRYEKTKRNFYGGAIGYLDFEGNFNHAIIIRSFLSQHNQLHYQAGAGIVADSVPENELQEVYNKLRALDKALTLAEEVS